MSKGNIKTPYKGHRLFGTTMMEYYVIHPESKHILGLFLTLQDAQQWIDFQKFPDVFEAYSFKERPLRMALDEHKRH